MKPCTPAGEWRRQICAILVGALMALTMASDGRGAPAAGKRKYRDLLDILTSLPESVRPAPGHKWDDVNFKLANKWLRENVDGIDFELMGTVKNKKPHRKDGGVSVELTMRPLGYEGVDVHPDGAVSFDARQAEKIAKIDEKSDIHARGTLKVSLGGHGKDTAKRWDMHVTLEHAELKS